MDSLKNYLSHTFDAGHHQLYSPNEITVRVCQEELWQKFNERTTEMIVTKAGRRMFPVIKLKVSGLDPHSMYMVILEFAQVGEHKYKFVNNQWVKGSKSEAKNPNKGYVFYTHPESPNYGSHFMKKCIEFPKVKLTNKCPPEEGQVVLNSLHEYEPKVHIIKSNPGQEKETFCFNLPQTRFIAVTAYQNESITELKIKNNPYAKAFAEKTRKRPSNPNYEFEPHFISPPQTIDNHHHQNHQLQHQHQHPLPHQHQHQQYQLHQHHFHTQPHQQHTAQTFFTNYNQFYQ